MITAELATAIPALVLVVALLTAVVGAASALAKASDAARSAARAASIGVASEQVLADAARLAPTGSQIELATEAGWVTVSVAPPPLRLGPMSLQLPDVSGSAPLEANLLGAGG